jgi:membrane protein YqaA with SNARE-associated domain
MKSEQKLLLARILAIIFVVSLSLFIYSIRDKAPQLAKFGYPGIFLLAFFAYATIILPAPGFFFVFTMGAVFNPIGVAIAAGLGAACGEIVGYLAGFSGQAVVQKSKHYERICNFMETNHRLRDVTILVFAFIPNPFFDLIGIVAGTLRFPIIRFLFLCAFGNILKMLVIAYLGESFFEYFNISL